MNRAIRYVTCKRCKAKFEAPRSDAKYCSNACRQAGHRKRGAAQRKRSKTRKEREATLRERRAVEEAAALEKIRRAQRVPMTPEAIAELRRRERIANLRWSIETCAKIAEHGREAEAAKAEFEAELLRLEEAPPGFEPGCGALQAPA